VKKERAMSRIQDILSKAEREGAVRHTHTPDASLPPRPEAPPSGAAAPPRRRIERAPLREARPLPEALREVAPGAFDPLLVAALAPHSLAAEQYRTLRTRIVMLEEGRARRVLLMTSPAKGDGKSITAANLALTMAQEFNRKVVLVDADLRQPTVHALLGIPQEPGVVDVLGERAALEDALVQLPDVRLAVVPAGLPPEQPAELLGSAGMRRLLEALRSRFDRVIVDVPPVIPLADVGVVAPQCDGVLLVVRAGATSKPLIERALGTFDAERVLGIVLNESGGAEPDYGYEYNYAQGQNGAAAAERR
jgi:capsular exopolysaccharide synthesis family protein